VLFIDARGRYLAESQLCAVVAVVLNLHAKAELETAKWPAGLGFPPFGADLLVDAPDLL